MPNQYTYTHIEEIRKILEDEITGDISTFSLETLSKLNEGIKKFLGKVAAWQQAAGERLGKSVGIQYKDPADQKLFSKLGSSEKKKALEDILWEAEGILREGYVIIDEIRTKITGETITYGIGVQYRGMLYEGTVSMQDIVSRAKVQIDGNTLDSVVKLRILAPKSTWRSLVETQNEGIAFKNDHSSLFTSIRAYSIENKIKNWGNIYETYKLLVTKYGSNKIPPARFNEMEFIAAYLETVKNTESFAQGGDILTEQVKFFGGSAPSLVSLATIRDVLTRFSESLDTKSMSTIQEAVKTIFMKQDKPQRAASDLEEEVIAWAEKHIGGDLGKLKEQHISITF